MNYIRITKDNIDKEHICCAMSGKQSVAKKEWLRQRFDDGLVFCRSAERGKCFIIKSAEYPDLVGGGMNAAITIYRQM